MDEALPQALVTGYEGLIPNITLPDPDDRHVLAAAITGRADVIVTYNLKDFPEEALAPYGIEAQHPDVFLNHQRTLAENLFLDIIKEARAALVVRPFSSEEYIEHLRQCGLQIIAAELEKAKSLI